MAARFEPRAEDLAQLVAKEVGKIVPHARFETGTAPANLGFNAALALTDYGRASEVDGHSFSIVIRHRFGDPSSSVS
jgi:betaine-aldehyde dehydrogenase